MQSKLSKLGGPVFKIVNILLTIGVFYFAYVYGRSLLEKADFSGLQSNWWMLLIAILCFIVFYVVSSLHWLRVCRLVDPGAKKTQALAYFASQPYKYLPTSIFSFSYRAKYAKQLGLALKKGAYAQLLENFNILGSGAMVTVTFFAFTKSFILGILCLAILAIAVLVSLRFKVIITIPFTKRKRRLHTYKLIPSFFMMGGAWIAGGLSFWLVNHSLNYSVDPLLAISANAAAFVVSILAIFAPGGVGVRELSLSLFTIQNSAIVLWRFLTFTVDMIVGFGVIVVIALRHKAWAQQ